MSGTINQTASLHVPSKTPDRTLSSSDLLPEKGAVSLNGENVDTIALNGKDELWVFGYGSLVWKVDFPIVHRQTGYIKGFRRRFFQHSIDHRGTAERPGRVVTLLPAEDDPESKVFGVAYQIPIDKHEQVIQHLDHREKNGYTRIMVDFFPYPDASEESAAWHRRICIYVATEDNESFAGPKPLKELAEQVLNAQGPSGANDEYVFRLAEAMRTLFPGEQDEHLFQLEAELLKLKRFNQTDNDEIN